MGTVKNFGVVKFGVRPWGYRGPETATALLGVRCSPTLPEPELTPQRYLDPDTGTTSSPEECDQSAQDPWQEEGQDPCSGKSASTSSAGPGHKRSPTASKKRCAEYLREQTDRSTAIVAIPAPTTAMTPVLQLSAEANAIVAAIHGALAQRLEGSQGRMGMLGGQMTSLKAEVNQLGALAQHHDQSMNDGERQLREIAVGRGAGAGATSSVGSA